MRSDKVLADEAETWGLRGTVYRRLSDLDGEVSKLHQALECYRSEVREAFKKVKANQGAAGVDGQTIAEFEADLSNDLP